MNNDQIKAYLQHLNDRKTELENLNSISEDARKPVTLDQQSVGRLSRMDAMQVQAMAQAQGRQRANELMRIERALTRIANDEFGYCDNCGDEIVEKRLNVDPAALFCFNCANANEH